jgi:hypothetical protein
MSVSHRPIINFNLDGSFFRPNEPSQSNMSPSDGVALWQEYINPLAEHGYYLVSPACTNDQTGLDWMAGFFQECTGCQVRLNPSLLHPLS